MKNKIRFIPFILFAIYFFFIRSYVNSFSYQISILFLFIIISLFTYFHIRKQNSENNKKNLIIFLVGILVSTLVFFYYILK